MLKCPFDAVGLQGHWSLQEPTEQELRAALDEYKSLGLKIQITELDVSIYPWEKDRRAKRPGESDAYTPELEQNQTAQYKMFFKVFRDYCPCTPALNPTTATAPGRRQWPTTLLLKPRSIM